MPLRHIFDRTRPHSLGLRPSLFTKDDARINKGKVMIGLSVIIVIHQGTFCDTVIAEYIRPRTTAIQPAHLTGPCHLQIFSKTHAVLMTAVLLTAVFFFYRRSDDRRSSSSRQQPQTRRARSPSPSFNGRRRFVSPFNDVHLAALPLSN